NVDILIHGGGLAGLACAAALRDSSWKVGLIEPRPQHGHEGQWDARVYAYTPAAVALLERLDVWQRLDPERWCAVDRIEVHGDRGGMLSFSAYEAGLSRLAVIAEQSLV
ncbi:ubiquinone biosynthesis protein UbiH, partial [Enterococcus faecalis]